MNLANTCLRGTIAAGLALSTATTTVGARRGSSGLRGDPAAIADARAMVATMGGIEVWRGLGCLELVHRWFPVDRIDSYVEHELLDLTGPRSLADRRSEIRHAIRSYGPEGGRWLSDQGRVTRGTAEELADDLARAPFNFYRLVRGVAADDPFYELRYGPGDIPGTRRIEFLDPDGDVGGWVILNAAMEPVVKATPAYRYTLGPLKRFGNLLLPAWGVYDTGYTRYEMVSLSAGQDPPEPARFLPPAGTP